MTAKWAMMHRTAWIVLPTWFIPANLLFSPHNRGMDQGPDLAF